MIDLHIHSTASDGQFTPTEVLNMAENIGLEAIALTDHDSVAGVKELHEAAQGKKIEVVNGAELSVTYPNASMEIIAMNIPEQSLPAFELFQKEQAERRLQVTLERLDKLQQFGVDITFEEVATDKNGRPRKTICKPHFTDILLAKGYISEPDEAYQVIFAEGGIGYVPNHDIPAADVIHFIKDNGAVPIMAHPILTRFSDERLFEVLQELAKEGLGGFELFQSVQPREKRQVYLEFLKELKFKTAGGSDFHGGTAHPENELGTGLNHNLNIPYFVLAELQSDKIPEDVYYRELEKFI